MISQRLLWVVAFSVFSPALARSAPAASAAEPQQTWLEVSEPAEAAQIQASLPLISVRGFAGTGTASGYDVLIALDRSVSVWGPSGADIDGDRSVGRSRMGVDLFADYKQLCTDPGDTILAAELNAARLLIEDFDAKNTRMGLLSFGGGAQVHAPIGSSRERLLHALASVPQDAEFGGTSFQNAFNLARAQFDGLPATSGAPRGRALILLSDGRPTDPSPVEYARRFAVQAAQDLGKSGVRVYSFAIGPEAIGDAAVYQEIANATGGALYLADSPRDVMSFAPYVSLTGIARIQIDNLSAAKPARAVRLLPDGGFDGFAPLVPGLNVLRVTAVGDHGELRAIDRRVYYQPVEGGSPAEMARLRKLLKVLQVRSLEQQMADAARQRMLREGRRIAIGVEP